MDLQLKGKKAIITGASRGVGRAIALGLAAEGADVALGATRPEGIEAVAKEAQAMGIAAYPIPVNLGNSEDTLAFMEKAEAALGGMDILINNAGIFPQGWCQDITLADWQHTLDVNLTGAFLTSQFFARANLAAERPGKIININSQAAFHGSTTGHAHYAASKAAMTAMTISMARELSPKGITVNGVALGVVETDMIREGIKKRPGYYESRIPIGHVAKPEEVANIVVFMASGPASYLTGTTIDATGGMLIR
ncbi:SDR family NAD(P)-dependent oxidoreductase [Eubacterium aggregans]|uniref:SDR family NAD(P)-dependent oxidoreductase n=1 Tax=Eubacterium aggregans TaxID=81409 RepID=UPI003F2F1748